MQQCMATEGKPDDPTVYLGLGPDLRAPILAGQSCQRDVQSAGVCLRCRMAGEEALATGPSLKSPLQKCAIPSKLQ